jgi:hypothetical protein
MAWSRLDDQLYDNMKVLSFSHPAFRLWVCSITYSNRQQTRGHLTQAAAVALARQQRVQAKAIQELVAKGGWDKNGDGGYVVHDYEQFNPHDPTAAERMRRHRAKGRVTE